MADKGLKEERDRKGKRTKLWSPLARHNADTNHLARKLRVSRSTNSPLPVPLFDGGNGRKVKGLSRVEQPCEEENPLGEYGRRPDFHRQSQCAGVNSFNSRSFSSYNPDPDCSFPNVIDPGVPRSIAFYRTSDSNIELGAISDGEDSNEHSGVHSYDRAFPSPGRRKQPPPLAPTLDVASPRCNSAHHHTTMHPTANNRHADYLSAKKDMEESEMIELAIKRSLEDSNTSMKSCHADSAANVMGEVHTPRPGRRVSPNRPTSTASVQQPKNHLSSSLAALPDLRRHISSSSCTAQSAEEESIALAEIEQEKEMIELAMQESLKDVYSQTAVGSSLSFQLSELSNAQKYHTNMDNSNSTRSTNASSVHKKPPPIPRPPLAPPFSPAPHKTASNCPGSNHTQSSCYASHSSCVSWNDEDDSERIALMEQEEEMIELALQNSMRDCCLQVPDFVDKPRGTYERRSLNQMENYHDRLSSRDNAMSAMMSPLREQTSIGSLSSPSSHKSISPQTRTAIANMATRGNLLGRDGEAEESEEDSFGVSRHRNHAERMEYEMLRIALQRSKMEL